MSNLKNSYTVSIRINGKTTSVSIRKNLIALWILLKNDVNQGNANHSENHQWKKDLNNFVYACSILWTDKNSKNSKNTISAKGFSDFISLRMIESFLEKEDFEAYTEILESI